MAKAPPAAPTIPVGGETAHPADRIRKFMHIADAPAMHLLARRQGVATLATAFHDDKFIRQEVKLMCDWLDACIAPDAPGPRPS